MAILTLAEDDLTNLPAQSALLCPPSDPDRNTETQEQLLHILLIFIVRKAGVTLIFLLCPRLCLIHMHAHTLTQTQPCCVLDFSHWQQVSADREDLCAGSLLLLLRPCLWTPLL